MLVVETVDVLDSLCSNIRVDTNGANIVRVLPRFNAFINNEWITDKIRFVSTGVKQSRMLVPIIRKALHFVQNGENVCSNYSPFRMSDGVLPVSVS